MVTTQIYICNDKLNLVYVSALLLKTLNYNVRDKYYLKF